MRYVIYPLVAVLVGLAAVGAIILLTAAIELTLTLWVGLEGQDAFAATQLAILIIVLCCCGLVAAHRSEKEGDR